MSGKPPCPWLQQQNHGHRGNPRFGRRDFLWHGGAGVVLDYQKRHVLGLAMDFAEDHTRSSWSLEFTWFPEVRMADLNSLDLTTRADLYNLMKKYAITPQEYKP